MREAVLRLLKQVLYVTQPPMRGLAPSAGLQAEYLFLSVQCIAHQFQIMRVKKSGIFTVRHCITSWRFLTLIW